MNQKALVCGGRDYSDRQKLYEVLDEMHRHKPIGLLIAGGARGADSLAADWASYRNVEKRVFRADWENEGRSAGVKRNQRMLDEGEPDLVVAFPGGRGTADMIRRAEAAKVPVVRVK